MFRSVVRVGLVLGTVGGVMLGGLGLAAPALAWGSNPGPIQYPATFTEQYGSQFTSDQRAGAMDGYQAKHAKVPAGLSEGLGRFDEIEFAWSAGYGFGSWIATDILDLPPADELWNGPAVDYTLPPSWCPNCDMGAAMPPGWVGTISFPSTAWTGGPPVKSSRTFTIGNFSTSMVFNGTAVGKTWTMPMGISSPVGAFHTSLNIRLMCRPTVGGVVTAVAEWNISADIASPVIRTPSGCNFFDHFMFRPTNNDTASAPHTSPYTGPLLGRWYPVGHGSYPPAQDMDPLRQLRSTVECQPEAGGPVYSNHSFTAPFRESVGKLPAIPEVACTGTGRVTRSTLWMVMQAAPFGPGEVLISEWVNPLGGGSVVPACDGCDLLLFRVDNPPALNCFNTPGLCSGWYVDPDRESKYECRYGSNVLDLEECLAYRIVFDTTAPPPGSDDEGCARWYVDTITGDCDDDEDDEELIGGPPPPDTDCPPSFGLQTLNPFWWFKAAGCAIEYAFVPSAESVNTFTSETRAAWEGTAIGQWGDALGGIFTGLSVNEAGCTGPTMTWRVETLGVDLVDLQPFNACTAPMSTVAGIGKTLATISLTIFGALACIKALGSGLGWSPGVGDGAK